jgi:hypothetical protein
MNWRRGFLRIWIVASAVWIFGVVYIAGIDRLKPLMNPHAKFQVELTDGSVHTFDTGIPLNDLQAKVALAFTRLGMKPADVAKSQKELIDELYKRNHERQSNSQIVLVLVAGPPLILLITGLLVGWIARGFRGI